MRNELGVVMHTVLPATPLQAEVGDLLDLKKQYKSGYMQGYISTIQKFKMRNKNGEEHLTTGGAEQSI